MSVKQWPWEIEKLPFYYAPLTTPSNIDMPNFLPFTLDVDQKTGLLVQIPNPIIDELLERAYEKGSTISGIMDDYGIGKQYADDFLKFIEEKFKGRLNDKKILEIGCGTGYLLYRLKEMGANVVGIEPGNHGQLGAEKYNVNIIQGFFPNEKVTEKFDIIIIYCVLEHVSNSGLFLQRVAKHLSYGGRIILAVPNCDPYISNGDVSMLFHEHFSYFSQETLQQVVINSIAKTIEVEQATFGGVLYGITQNDCKTSLRDNFSFNSSDYHDLAEKHTQCILKYFEEHNQEEIGIYVAGRAINALTFLEEKIDFKKVRFFDDNSMLQNMYFPGFPMAVESRKQLEENPPQRILIMSFSFGEIIKKQLKKLFADNFPIETIDDIS